MHSYPAENHVSRGDVRKQFISNEAPVFVFAIESSP